MYRLLALTAFALVALPAAAEARGACPPPAPGERFSVAIVHEGAPGGPTDRALRVCDGRTGSSRVLDRSRQVHVVPKGEPWPIELGSEITNADVLGDRVAWTTERVTRRGAATTVTLASAATGRVLRRFLAGRVRRAGLFASDVELLPGGGLAWLTTSPRASNRQRLVLELPGRRRRLLDEDAIGDLVLEGAGTLVWLAGTRTRFHELTPPPRAGGCPARAGAETLVSTDAVLVTRHIYGSDEDSGTAVLRACDRATGADPVVSDSVYAFGGGAYGSVHGAFGRWVLLSSYGYDKGSGCSGGSVRTIEAGTGRLGRAGRVPCEDLPGTRPVVAATAAGVPVWLTEGPKRVRLLAAAPDGRAVELDAGRPGAITALQADGAEARWRNDGEPRSATLP